MSEEIQVCLPKLGESILSATIVQWFKKIGDRVNLDEPLLEVSTDKVNSEIPSPAAGILKAIYANPDQELQVGDLIAVIAAQAGHGAFLSCKCHQCRCKKRFCTRHERDFLSCDFTLGKRKWDQFGSAQ